MGGDGAVKTAEGSSQTGAIVQTKVAATKAAPGSGFSPGMRWVKNEKLEHGEDSVAVVPVINVIPSTLPIANPAALNQTPATVPNVPVINVNQSTIIPEVVSSAQKLTNTSEVPDSKVLPKVTNSEIPSSLNGTPSLQGFLNASSFRDEKKEKQKVADNGIDLYPLLHNTAVDSGIIQIGEDVKGVLSQVSNDEALAQVTKAATIGLTAGGPAGAAVGLVAGGVIVVAKGPLGEMVHDVYDSTLKPVVDSAMLTQARMTMGGIMLGTCALRLLSGDTDGASKALGVAWQSFYDAATKNLIVDNPITNWISETSSYIANNKWQCCKNAAGFVWDILAEPVNCVKDVARQLGYTDNIIGLYKLCTGDIEGARRSFEEGGRQFKETMTNMVVNTCRGLGNLAVGAYKFVDGQIQIYAGLIQMAAGGMIMACTGGHYGSGLVTDGGRSIRSGLQSMRDGLGDMGQGVGEVLKGLELPLRVALNVAGIVAVVSTFGTAGVGAAAAACLTRQIFTSSGLKIAGGQLLKSVGIAARAMVAESLESGVAKKAAEEATEKVVTEATKGLVSTATKQELRLAAEKGSAEFEKTLLKVSLEGEKIIVQQMPQVMSTFAETVSKDIFKKIYNVNPFDVQRAYDTHRFVRAKNILKYADRTTGFDSLDAAQVTVRLQDGFTQVGLSAKNTFFKYGMGASRNDVKGEFIRCVGEELAEHNKAFRDLAIKKYQTVLEREAIEAAEAVGKKGLLGNSVKNSVCDAGNRLSASLGDVFVLEVTMQATHTGLKSSFTRYFRQSADDNFVQPVLAKLAVKSPKIAGVGAVVWGYADGNDKGWRGLLEASGNVKQAITGRPVDWKVGTIEDGVDLYLKRRKAQAAQAERDEAAAYGSRHKTAHDAHSNYGNEDFAAKAREENNKKSDRKSGNGENV